MVVNQIHKIFSVIALMLLPISVSTANTVVTKASVGNSHRKPVVIVDEAQVNQRVCLYQGEAYSLGAILEIRDLVLLCKESNDFELNGALKWEAIESSYTRSDEQ
ncbi:DUF1496 domain-containing protein [Vibrio sp. FNV 38]|nr:DUF1496 domain-containing protein [Vibrio sp. FNV 38]